MSTAERKRQLAVAKWREAQKERNRVQRSDFQGSVDRPTSAKRIKFDSDSEQSDSGSKDEKGKVSSTSHKLFDSDSESDAANLKIDECKLMNGADVRFTMKSGAVAALDERFRMDNQFLDDAAKDDEISNGRHGERHNQIKILSKVLGRSVSMKDAPVTEVDNGLSKAAPMIRFDPDNPEHYHFDLSKNRAVKANDRARKSSARKEATPNASDSGSESDSSSQQEAAKSQPQTDAKPSHKMDKSFAESLRKNLQGKGQQNPLEAPANFSLLASLGRSNDVTKNQRDKTLAKKKPNEEVQEYEEIAQSVQAASDAQKVDKLRNWQREVLASSMQHGAADHRHADSSGDEADPGDDLDTNQPTCSQAVPKTSDRPASQSTQTFFGDPSKSKQIQKAVNAFRRTQPMSVIERSWNKKRPILMKIFKAAHKNAVRQSNLRLRRSMAHQKPAKSDEKSTQGKSEASR